MKLRVVIFRRRLGWYWRLVAANNRIVAIGGEPFASPSNARRSFRQVWFAAIDTEPPVEVKR